MRPQQINNYEKFFTFKLEIRFIIIFERGRRFQKKQNERAKLFRFCSYRSLIDSLRKAERVKIKRNSKNYCFFLTILK